MTDPGCDFVKQISRLTWFSRFDPVDEPKVDLEVRSTEEMSRVPEEVDMDREETTVVEQEQKEQVHNERKGGLL